MPDWKPPYDHTPDFLEDYNQMIAGDICARIPASEERKACRSR
jgi:hypothetical protein